ncbi:unnamed protein product [Moneuplotes crassus]|uniref:Uncharacterized protein n=1 Tax=Euplotes crassus TaxID=5936 RepID=A0AAD1XBH6_EUPCR|nr:unnamed protein product [Moneuplotes crassus]
MGNLSDCCNKEDEIEVIPRHSIGKYSKTSYWAKEDVIFYEKYKNRSRKLMQPRYWNLLRVKLSDTVRDTHKRLLMHEFYVRNVPANKNICCFTKLISFGSSDSFISTGSKMNSIELVNKQGYYIGEVHIEKNCFQGKGAALFQTGSLYEGFWVNNLPHGQGRLIYPEGSYYRGQWKEGKRHGNGEFRSSSGVTYIGQWHEDYKHGNGQEFFPDGSYYKGGFCMNEYEGEAEILYPNGEKYKGEYRNSNHNGKGTLHFSDGKSYEGTFSDSVINGYGVYKFDKGGNKVYEGNFKDGAMHGEGVIKFATGDTISGTWKEGKKHGSFKYQSPMQPVKYKDYEEGSASNKTRASSSIMFPTTPQTSSHVGQDAK